MATMSREEIKAGILRSVNNSATNSSKSIEVNSSANAGQLNDNSEGFSRELVMEALGGDSSGSQVTEEEPVGSSQIAKALTKFSNPGVDVDWSGVGDEIRGGAEVAGSMLTGTAASAVGGLGGIKDLLKGGSAIQVNETLNEFTGEYTYAPNTRHGKKYMSVVSDIGEKVDRVVSDVAFEAGLGNPIASTVIKTVLAGVLEFVPAFGGVGKVTKTGGIQTRKQRLESKIQDIQNMSTELGIDLDSPTLREDIKGAAESISVEFKADTMNELHESLLELKEKARADVNDKYDLAEKVGADASIPAESLRRAFKGKDGSFQELSLSMRDKLIRFGYVEEMPAVGRILAEIKALSTKNDGIIDKDNLRENVIEDAAGNVILNDKNKIVSDTLSPVTLNQLSHIRKRMSGAVTKNYPATVAKYNQDEALMMMKSELDNFIGDIFEQDMITGSPAAISRWKEALEANALMKSKFEGKNASGKVITKLITKEADPMAYKKYITNSSFAGHKNHAVNVVRRLKDLFGENSTEMKNLQFEYNYDLLEPLLDTKDGLPDIVAFRDLYEKHRRNNKALFDEMSGGAIAGADVEKLLSLAKSVDDLKIGSPESLARVQKIETWANRVGVSIVGSGLAKSAMHVSLLGQVLTKARQSLSAATKKGTRSEGTKKVGYTEGNNAKVIIADLLGIKNLNKPVIDKSNVIYSSLLVDQFMQEPTVKKLLRNHQNNLKTPIGTNGFTPKIPLSANPVPAGESNQESKVNFNDIYLNGGRSDSLGTLGQ